MGNRSGAADVAAHAAARQWREAHFSGRSAEPPFAFHYGGRDVRSLLAGWRRTAKGRRLDPNRTERTVTYRDPDTGLEVRCVCVAYRDFPTVEWTVHLRNTGASSTPLIENLLAMEAAVGAGAAGGVTLHHHRGSVAAQDDYRPIETPLQPGEPVRIATSGGRPSNCSWPYFNIAWPGGGAIVVVGWPGQWAARFLLGDAGVRVEAGQEQTRFRLLPGEEVRTPRMVVQHWTGDRIDAQNVWRRWMVAHNMPRPGGSLPPTQFVACSSHQFGEMIDANEENQKLFIDRYLAEGLRIDYWWMDAGWYLNDGSWVNTGTWEVDPKRFPNGLRAITDHAHAAGVRSIVWFEPERVTLDSWLARNHPEWLLAPPPNPGDELYDEAWRLLDLGNPQAWRWLVEHIDRLIVEQGVDLYRQDFNVAPLLFWRSHDAEDRQGITEIRYVEGYLAYWDELRRRHPGMLIDSCASGGRRNDIDTLRRAVPLIRSDCLFEPIAEQCHAYGIASWVPFHGTGTLAGPSRLQAMPDGGVDAYMFRSHMAANVTACWDMRRDDLDYAELRRLVGQLRQASPCYLGDYYPLTPYSLLDDAWVAWQFDRPADGDGIVQAFRRGAACAGEVILHPRGLQPDAMYAVTDADTGECVERAGRDLLETGLRIAIPGQPGAALVTYRRLDPAGA